MRDLTKEDALAIAEMLKETGKENAKIKYYRRPQKDNVNAEYYLKVCAAKNIKIYPVGEMENSMIEIDSNWGKQPPEEHGCIEISVGKFNEVFLSAQRNILKYYNL